MNAFLLTDDGFVEAPGCEDQWSRLPRLEMKRWAQDTRALDRCGRRRSAATDPSFRRGVKPGNYGKTYYATPYTDAEVLSFMAACDELAANARDIPMHNPRTWRRMRALIALLWRSGLRISEALDLVADDLNPDEGTVTVRCGKGGKRRISAMDPWGFAQVIPWMVERQDALPPGPLFCIAEGPTKGERWTPAGVRAGLAKVKAVTGFEGRLAPHQLRHTHAVGLAKEGVLLPLLSRQLGHSNIATTSTYLSGISPQDVINAISARPVPGS